MHGNDMVPALANERYFSREMFVTPEIPNQMLFVKIIDWLVEQSISGVTPEQVRIVILLLIFF